MRTAGGWIALGIALGVFGCSAEPEAGAPEVAEAQAEAAAEPESEPGSETPATSETGNRALSDAQADGERPAAAVDAEAAQAQQRAEGAPQAEVQPPAAPAPSPAPTRSAGPILARIAECQREIDACEARVEGLEMMKCVNEAYVQLGVWWKDRGESLDGLSSQGREQTLRDMQALEGRIQSIASRLASQG